MTSPRIVLMGPPGSGKSSTGRLLSKSLGAPWRDTDQDIAKTEGKSIPDIFVEDGETHFRQLEAAAVAKALAEHDGILSLGGGAILDADTQARIHTYAKDGGMVVFLNVSLNKAAPRVGLNRSRPLLMSNPRQQWHALMEARRPIYTRLATHTVDTDDLSPDQVAKAIEKLEESQ